MLPLLTTAELGLRDAETQQIARPQVHDVGGDIRIERRRSVGDTGLDKRNQFVETPFDIEELPDQQANIVDPVVGGGIEMQEDAPLALGERMESDTWIPGDPRARLDLVGCCHVGPIVARNRS